MNNYKNNASPIIIALDFPTAKQALALAEQLDPTQYAVKIGKSLFTRHGPLLVERLVKFGFRVFLDLKFYDIPNTVAEACTAAADLGVWMLNVHALGGKSMLKAAVKALQTYDNNKPILIAVTILTSLASSEIHQVGLQGSLNDNVKNLASIAQESGCNGVVCSPHEAQSLRQQCGSSFCLVTPGIRLPYNDTNDQARVMTPAQAIKAGANYLVIGRPIIESANPLQTLKLINENL